MVKKLVFGVGVNDADYPVTTAVNGRRVICQFYQVWASMLARCYCAKRQARNPTYIGCSVAPEWIKFSVFKRWMESQDWRVGHLDKDLLFIGNKVYSPETCVFVDGMTNKFTIDHGAARGEWPLGVYFKKEEGKFRAQCSNQFTKKNENLGYFTCPNEAHQAWKKRKHELACRLADLQTDKRVAAVLRTRYL